MIPRVYLSTSHDFHGGGKRQDNNQGTISGDSSSADDTTNTQRKGWVAACASILIVVLIVCVGMYIWRNIGSSVDDPIAGDDKSSPTQEYKEDPDDLNGISVQFYEHPTAINEALNLRPKILPETCTRYYPSDITFQVSDPSVADVKYQNDQYVLFVKKRSKTDVQIKVRAFIHDKLLGEQTYTIAKKQEPPKPIADPNKFVVPTYQGRPRTIKEYIGNLRNDVNKNPKLKDKTIQICQQIINSSNYPNNADAIVLRDSLNNVADAGF